MRQTQGQTALLRQAPRGWLSSGQLMTLLRQL